jgi:hypothetical protein
MINSYNISKSLLKKAKIKLKFVIIAKNIYMSSDKLIIAPYTMAPYLEG